MCGVLAELALCSYAWFTYAPAHGAATTGGAIMVLLFAALAATGIGPVVLLRTPQRQKGRRFAVRLGFACFLTVFAAPEGLFMLLAWLAARNHTVQNPGARSA